jgi:hypothetical protein
MKDGHDCVLAVLWISFVGVWKDLCTVKKSGLMGAIAFSNACTEGLLFRSNVGPRQ